MSGRDPLSGVTPVDANGNVYALATIDYYIVGTTTREDTFTTAGLSVAHPNPITLGADGRIPEIFFSQTRMKRVFKDSGGSTITGLSWDGIDKSKQRVKASSAPSPTYPGLEWHDTSTGNLKERNAANTGWNDRGDIDDAGAETITINTQTGTTYTIDTADRGDLISHSNGSAVAVTLPQGIDPNFGSGWHVWYRNAGAGVITITPTTSTINGAATLVLEKGQYALIVSDGTNYIALHWGSPGKQTIWVPASAMTTRSTNGAAAATVESSTNKIMRSLLDFDQTTQEYAQFTVAMPKGWNESTVTAVFLWECTVTGNVVWGLQGLASSDDDVIDTAFGTGIEVTDGVTATTDLMISAETAAITLGGTPAENDVATFQVYRNAGSGSDTAAGDARLRGVKLFLTYDSATDR